MSEGQLREAHCWAVCCVALSPQTTHVSLVGVSILKHLEQKNVWDFMHALRSGMHILCALWESLLGLEVCLGRVCACVFGVACFEYACFWEIEFHIGGLIFVCFEDANLAGFTPCLLFWIAGERYHNPAKCAFCRSLRCPGSCIV